MLITKIRKVVVACAATLGLLTVGMSSAIADTPVKAPWEPGAPATGSIKIIKAEDGNPSTKVGGAKFTITPITQIKGKDVTLSTMAGWRQLAKSVDDLNDNKISDAQLTMGSPEEKETTAAGVAEFTGKPVGLYKVVESLVPDGYSSEIKPFYVTIPQITGADKKTADFKYDVVVEPKNKNLTSKVIKTAETSSMVGQGDTITYPITAELNKTKASNGNKDLTKDDIQGFNVFDDALKAAYTNLNEGAVAEVKVNDTKLEKNTHYTVSVNDVTGDNSRSRIAVNFNDAGLDKIAEEANKNGNESTAVMVKVKMAFVVAQDAPQSVVNKYGFTPGKGEGEPPVKPVTPGENTGGSKPNPETKFVDLQIKKVSAKDGKTAVKGAKFKLFASKEQANKCAADPTVEANCKGASKVGELVSGADGLTTKVRVKESEMFWAVETEAPNDYVRATQPEAVNATAPKRQGAPFMFRVENVAKADSNFWFNLPKTGAFGVGLFALIGLGLVGGGTTMFVRSAKSRKEN